MRELKNLEIPEDIEGERIDSALAKLLGFSRSVIVKLLDSGEVSLGHRKLGKSDKVQKGQIISVLLPEPPSGIAIPPTPLAELKIVFQDADLVIVNKPVEIGRAHV